MNKRNYTTDYSEVLRTEARLVDLNVAEDGSPFRFQGIVDQHGNQLAAVTDRYALVQNIDVARAVADALYDNGVVREDLERGRAFYSQGRTTFSLRLPEAAFKAPGDSSETMPQIEVRNDYRGGGSLSLRIGIYRVICTNGLIAFDRGEMIKLRHVGTLDYAKVYEQVLPVIAGLLQTAENQKEVAALLASVPSPHAWVDQLLQDTAKRYQSRLGAAIQRNREDLGDNAWAVAQAISEHATHERPQGWAAGEWATTAVQDLLATVKETV